MIEQRNLNNRLTPISNRRVSSVQNNYGFRQRSSSRQSRLKQSSIIQSYIPQILSQNINLNYTPTWNRQTLMNQVNKSIQPPLSRGEDYVSQEKFQQQKNRFFNIIRKVPIQRRLRSQQNLQQIIIELCGMNNFFKPLGFLFSCSLMKMGRIRFYEENQIIYDKKQDLSSFFVILWGKVKLFDKRQSFKKLSIKGQSLAQQIIFTELKTRQQRAKAIQDTYLLQISIKTWDLLREAAINNNLKNQVFLMEKWLRRNMLNKNSLRATKLL